MDNRMMEDESVDIRFLSDIMVARYEEIFELINEDLILHQKDGRLPGGVILTG
jgi:cell division ATPase FtsA